MRRYPAILLLLLLSSAAFSQALPEKPNTMLWAIVNAKGDTSYLLGTYHDFGANIFRRYPLIEWKMKCSQAVYLESLNDNSYFPGIGMVGPLRRAWVDTLSKSDYKAVDKYLKKLGYDAPLSQLRGLDPFELKYSMMLELRKKACKLVESEKEPAMESYIYSNCRQKGKTLLGLETDADTGVLATIRFVSGEESAAEAVKGIIDMAHNEREWIDSIRAWGECQGPDEYRMADIEYQFEEASVNVDSNYAYALDLRNANWLPTMKKAIDKESTFFAVGLGHLKYKKGLVNLLREGGYTVLPVSIK